MTKSGPMPTNSIVEFILYVVPGFIAAEIFHAKYPVRERSDAIQISWSVVYGLAITYALRWLDNGYFCMVSYNRTPVKDAQGASSVSLNLFSP